MVQDTEGRSIVSPHPSQRHSAATSNSDDITAHRPFSIEHGLTVDIRPVVRDWLDRLCAESANLKTFQRHRVRRIILALGDANLIVDTFRRLNLFLNTAEEVTRWLVHTGVSALDVVENSILNKPDYLRRIAVEMLDTFLGKADSVETVSTIFRISRRPEFASKAIEWLKAHPRETVIGLVEMVSNGDPLAEEACRLLLMCKENGHAEILAEELQTAPSEVTRQILETKLPEPAETVPFDNETTPDWLREGLAESVPGDQVPAWCPLNELPLIKIGKFHLNAEQLRDLLGILQKVISSRISEQANSRFFETLTRMAGREGMLDFAWSIYEAWRKGGNLNDGWAVVLLGFWGDDNTATALYEQIKPRVGNYNSIRDAFYFEAFRGIGTPMALSYLRGHDHNPNLFHSSGKARTVYHSIAAERNIPPNELDLQAIPDCGLDSEGRRAFNYGPRKIIVNVGSDFNPVIANEYGKKKKRFPAPVRKDNPELTRKAQNEWKMLRCQLSWIREFHVPEFKLAMLTRRTWEVDSFFRYLIPHPLMKKLCRELVWGAFTKQGAFLTAFRVCEDNTLSSRTDRNFKLPPECRIGIVHPALMSAEEHHLWIETFNEYSLTQPFPQLNRPIGRLTEDEWKDDRITRFNSTPIDERLLKQRLSEKGWTAPDYHHQKPEIGIKHFTWLKVTAVADYNREKITFPAQPFYWQRRTIRECYFLSGYGSSKMPVYSQPKIPLHLIDPIVISETLADLTQILTTSL